MIPRLRQEANTLLSRALNAVRPVQPLSKPIFLVGTVRSGSTLVARTLGAHRSVRYLRFELSEEWARYSGLHLAFPERGWGVCPRADARSATSARVRGIRRGLARTFAARGGVRGERMLNKNPHLSNKLEFVLKAFPDADLIVTSRDLYSTVASMKLMWQRIAARLDVVHYLPERPGACWACLPRSKLGDIDGDRVFPGGRADVLARYWLDTYEQIDAAARGFNTVIGVPIDEMLSDPAAQLRRIESALGLEVGATPVPEGLDATRNRRWRETLDPTELEALDRFCSDNAERIDTLRCARAALPGQAPRGA